MSFKEQILASFIGTFFGFIFAIILFLITNWVQKKLANKAFKKHLGREFQYDIKLLQGWIDETEVVLRKITAKDKKVLQYIKYSDLGRYFMDESFKLGLIYNLFNNEQVFKLNKLVTHCSLATEQYINGKISEWKCCLVVVENICQKEVLEFFEYQRTQLKDFKDFLDELLKKIT